MTDRIFYTIHAMVALHFYYLESSDYRFNSVSRSPAEVSGLLLPYIKVTPGVPCPSMYTDIR